MKKWSMQAMLLAAAVSAAGDAPYLPVSGPVPLRFANPPVRKAVAVQLPPLAIIEPRPAAAAPPEAARGDAPSPVPKAAAETPPVNPPPAPADPVLPAPAQYDPVVSNAVEIVRPDTENLTPQMFMRFFSGRPGTNSSGVSFITPMPFVPPAPPAPSSTATFQTTPPAKP